MKEFITKTLELFKSKNISLSADEAAGLLSAATASEGTKAEKTAAAAKPADNAAKASGSASTAATNTEEKTKTATAAVDTSGVKHNASTIQEVEKFYKAELEKKDAHIQTMSADIAQIKKLLGDQQTATEKANALIEENRKKEQAEKVSKKLEEAIKAGKIPPLNKDLQEKLKKQLEDDYDTASVVIDSLPNQSNAQTTTTTTGSGTGTGARTGLGSIVPDHIMARLEKN